MLTQFFAFITGFTSSILQFKKQKMRFRGQFLLLTLALVTLAVAKEEKEKNKEVGTVIGIDLGTTYSW